MHAYIYTYIHTPIYIYTSIQFASYVWAPSKDREVRRTSRQKQKKGERSRES